MAKKTKDELGQGQGQYGNSDNLQDGPEAPASNVPEQEQPTASPIASPAPVPHVHRVVIVTALEDLIAYATKIGPSTAPAVVRAKEALAQEQQKQKGK